MAWSSSACKELKRLCTRVSKKRQIKLKSPSTVTHEIPNAFPMAPPDFLSPSHPSIPGFLSQVPISQQAKSSSSTLPIPQFQVFGAPQRGPTQASSQPNQSREFQPLSYYQQIHNNESQKLATNETMYLQM